MKTLSQLVDDYAHWIRRGTAVEQVGDYCWITTPFLDWKNDHIQVYAKRDGEYLVLTDDGHACAEILTSPERIKSVVPGFGVSLVGGELVTRATDADFPQRLQSLVLVILFVGADARRKSRNTKQDPPDTLPLNLAARCLRVPARWLRDEIEAGRIPALIAGRSVLVHVPTVAAILTERAKAGSGLDRDA